MNLPYKNVWYNTFRSIQLVDIMSNMKFGDMVKVSIGKYASGDTVSSNKGQVIVSEIKTTVAKLCRNIDNTLYVEHVSQLERSLNKRFASGSRLIDASLINDVIGDLNKTQFARIYNQKKLIRGLFSIDTMQLQDGVYIKGISGHTRIKSSLLNNPSLMFCHVIKTDFSRLVTSMLIIDGKHTLASALKTCNWHNENSKSNTASPCITMNMSFGEFRVYSKSSNTVTIEIRPFGSFDKKLVEHYNKTCATVGETIFKLLPLMALVIKSSKRVEQDIVTIELSLMKLKRSSASNTLLSAQIKQNTEAANVILEEIEKLEAALKIKKDDLEKLTQATAVLENAEQALELSQKIIGGQ